MAVPPPESGYIRSFQAEFVPSYDSYDYESNGSYYDSYDYESNGSYYDSTSYDSSTNTIDRSARERDTNDSRREREDKTDYTQEQTEKALGYHLEEPAPSTVEHLEDIFKRNKDLDDP